MKINRQNPNPANVCIYVSPLTIALRIKPIIKPEKLPHANNSPAAKPSPTGKAN